MPIAEVHAHQSQALSHQSTQANVAREHHLTDITHYTQHFDSELDSLQLCQRQHLHSLKPHPDTAADLEAIKAQLGGLQRLTESMPGGQLTEGFLKSWGIILVSEIGDKTFFIAAIMAMKNRRATVFAGAVSALAVMTALSAALGWAAPNLISKKYTHYAAIALFFFFGARSLWEAYTSGAGDSDELEEVEKEVQEKEAKRAAARGSNSRKDHPGASDTLASLLSPVFVEAFVLTFLAEWGDRSQIATIGLAASIDIVGVTLGGILGHSICTGAAVLGGRQLATHIQERTVHLVGGLLFIAFGIHACFEKVE